MKKLFLCFPALLLLAVSCEKEPVFTSLVKETVSGSRGVSTKATISDADASFAWTEGDDVAVHISNGKYVYTSDEGASAAHITDVIHADDASFTVAYEAGNSRDAFAVFPSTIVAKDAANYGQEGHALDVTLPASYTLAQLSGEVSPCPMIAANKAGEGWDFYQLCSLLRLTVDNIPSTAKRLEIDFNGKKVSGAFSIAADVTPGTSEIVTEDDAANDCITVTKDGSDVTLGATSLVLNIPLPTGVYEKISVVAYDALTDGNAIQTITRPFDRTVSISGAFKRSATFSSAKKAFRGYEVSTGVLLRSVEGSNPATYSLTGAEMVMTYDPVTGKEVYALPAGCNPFEPAVNYKKSGALNKYFNKWGVLKSELGADGNNIDATSSLLPAGWRFPSAGRTSHEAGTDWGNILFSTPKSSITVNGTTVSAAKGVFALVSVSLGAENGYSVAAGTYYGMFLLRDGSTIPTGYLTKLGYDSKYTDNPLTESQFNDLIQMGCLFISATGYYSDLFGSWYDLNSSYQEGYYWSNTYYSSTSYYQFVFTELPNVSVANKSSSAHRNYLVVKLVKMLS